MFLFISRGKDQNVFKKSLAEQVILMSSVKFYLQNVQAVNSSTREKMDTVVIPNATTKDVSFVAETVEVFHSCHYFHIYFITLCMCSPILELNIKNT